MSKPDAGRARSLLREGLPREASQAYARLLEGEPDNAEAWHGYAMALYQIADLARAQLAAERAATLDRTSAHYAYLAGYVAFEQEQFALAVRWYSTAVANSPQWVPAHQSLGESLFKLGNFEQAEASFARALSFRSDDANLWSWIAVARWQRAAHEGAVAAARKALAYVPGHPMARIILARAAIKQGDLAEAARQVEATLEAQPEHVEALALRATILRRQRDARTTPAFEAALRVDPSNAPLHVAFADFLWESGDTGAAVSSFRSAEAIDPGSFRAAVGARLALPQVYHSVTDLQECRARYSDGIAKLEESLDRFCHPRADGLEDATWTNFFLAYQGFNDVDLQTRYGDVLTKSLAHRMPALAQCRPPRRVFGRIRVGFLSHFFFNCTAGRYFSSWVFDLDPRQFETFVYYTNAWVSLDTEAIRSAASHFRHLHGLPLAQMAEKVMEDKLDLLIFPEVGMHGETFVLAALRLAPIQLAGWGHPTTSGLPTIDGYLSCGEMEPDGAPQHYRERLHLLPGLGTRYRKPETISSKRREEYGLPDGKVLFLCPQSIFKIHPENDELFAAVLSACPNSRLVMFEGRNPVVTRAFLERMERALRRAEVDPDKAPIVLKYVQHGDYLRINALCDVMLDTLHWSGGNTALDAVAMGLPIVTLPGRMMRGRQTAGILWRMGMGELVATNTKHYEDIAVRLGTDAAWRYECRAKLRRGAQLVFDQAMPTTALAELLERLVSEAT